MQPINEQFEFLQNIKRVSVSELEKIYESVSSSTISTLPKANDGKLVIALTNETRISRDGMTTQLINFLKEELNFASTEFIIKKKIGKNIFGTERHFKSVKETENEVIVPRGFIGKLIRLCRENKIEYDFFDERKKLKETHFSLNAKLRA